jgi:hypothetical protein
MLANEPPRNPRKPSKAARKRAEERARRRVRQDLRVARLPRDGALGRVRLRSRPASVPSDRGRALPNLRQGDGKRVFWTASVGMLGTLVACRRPTPLEPVLAALGVVDPPCGERALRVSAPEVLPWRPLCGDGDGDGDGDGGDGDGDGIKEDAVVSLARLESPLYGTVFLVCGNDLAAGTLGVSSRALDRLCAAVRSVLSF